MLQNSNIRKASKIPITKPIVVEHSPNPSHTRSHSIISTLDHTSAATNGKMLKANANGLPVDATNTDADVADAVSKKHTQGTDTAIVLPHMMQSDSTDQAIANVNSAQVITFDTDVHHQNITRTSSSRFTILNAGSYLITFSGVTLCGTAGKRIEVWLRVDGSDLANSNTVYIFKSANANTVIACSYIVHFTANQYFEFWTWGDDTGAKWDATAATTAPAVVRPACPSIIITCNFISTD